MHFCGLHCIKFTVISKFQVEGLWAQACLSHRRDFFQDGIFQKEFFFSDGFFYYFFRLSIFWGCSFDSKIGLLSIYEVSRAIPALLHPVWSQLRISCFMNSIFFFEVEIFFRNAIFQKYFFFEWIFSTTFFSLRIFLGCRFDPEIGPLSIYEVFRAIPVLLHPRLEEISDFHFFINSFFFFRS